MHILIFQMDSLPSEFLGSPLIENSVRNSSWKELLSKLFLKLSNWTIRTLNLLTRVVLLKHVLKDMPLYLLSVMVSPKHILKEIRHIHCNYLSSRYHSIGKWSLVAYENVCTPKIKGYLGLRYLKVINSVMVLKTFFNFVFNPNHPQSSI